MYVFDYIFISSFAVCRTPSLLSLLILTALTRFSKMFHWMTVGLLVPTDSPASLYLLPASNGWETPKECILQMWP